MKMNYIAEMDRLIAFKEKAYPKARKKWAFFIGPDISEAAKKQLEKSKDFKQDGNYYYKDAIVFFSEENELGGRCRWNIDFEPYS